MTLRQHYDTHAFAHPVRFGVPLALGVTLALGVALPGAAFAGPDDDGYCDFVEGSAAATAATLSAPELFGQFGYIEQPSFTETPTGDTSDLRVIGGARFSVTNLLVGRATKARAAADCRRHEATIALRGATTVQALTARLRVYTDAMRDAERILADANTDLEARRISAPEASATRMRVEELRALESATARELAALPAPKQGPLRELLATYRTADADMEASEGKLRSLAAYDVSLRIGVDRFLQGPNSETRPFAVVQVGFNLGRLWLGSANDRAARGRKRYVRSEQDPLLGDTTTAQLRHTIEIETKRATQLSTLVADLDRQMQALAQIGTDDSKRFRETLWFDWVKAKAELAYIEALVGATRDVLAVYGE